MIRIFQRNKHSNLGMNKPAVKIRGLSRIIEKDRPRTAESAYLEYSLGQDETPRLVRISLGWDTLHLMKRELNLAGRAMDESVLINKTLRYWGKRCLDQASERRELPPVEGFHLAHTGGPASAAPWRLLTEMGLLS